MAEMADEGSSSRPRPTAHRPTQHTGARGPRPAALLLRKRAWGFEWLMRLLGVAVGCGPRSAPLWRFVLAAPPPSTLQCP